MTFTEFCMLFLACAILALVRVLVSILQEHRLESGTRNVDVADRAPRPAIRNRDAAPARHSAADHRANDSQVRISAARSTGFGVRFRSPALPSAQSVADAILSGIPNLSLPAMSRARRTSASFSALGTRPSIPVPGPSTSRGPLPGPSTCGATAAGPSTSRATAAGPSTSRASLSAAVAGPSTPRAFLPVGAAGPSASRTSLPASVAGPSIPRQALTSGVGAHNDLSASLGASVPWSPKKGWTSTCNVNGIVYHRTEKRMRPRKSLKAGSEEAEIVITPYWEPEHVAARLIAYPPDLSGNVGLAVGDLFIFHMTTHYRIWIYRAGGLWERVEVGYQREDGRFLIVTPVKKEPSWVSREYFERQINRQADSDSD